MLCKQIVLAARGTAQFHQANLAQTHQRHPITPQKKLYEKTPNPHQMKITANRNNLQKFDNFCDPIKTFNNLSPDIFPDPPNIKKIKNKNSSVRFVLIINVLKGSLRWSKHN
eukprot:GHVO01030590.1.p1 GENE.GHVO01030590.1~~GHVO01030590.1.p1  ORF type:complete len:112 (+),score=2.11 GHVO01030590.1:403-738(+)